mmetsp:Transcript_68026/g.221450  ORF Transcript_68026/g.221450 Transcript_68026/m.221450 type:complete len:125 (+) Transcript_68026:125-499(+)
MTYSATFWCFLKRLRVGSGKAICLLFCPFVHMFVGRSLVDLCPALGRIWDAGRLSCTFLLGPSVTFRETSLLGACWKRSWGSAGTLLGILEYRSIGPHELLRLRTSPIVDGIRMGPWQSHGSPI